MLTSLTNPPRVVADIVTIQYLCYLAGSFLFLIGSVIGLILNLKS